MDEEHIRKIVKLKMDAAGGIIDMLSPEVSGKIIHWGRLVLDSIEENLRTAEPDLQKAPPGKMNNIIIE